MAKRNYPLVHQLNFANATRDTGYRSTAAAVSELIDNAVQAGASNIRVIVGQIGLRKAREITVAVWDDGCGMSASVLQQALQFGGSTHFNDRKGLGRFGMGLPNSSLSQARRVEVFTWRSPRRVLRSYLDLDEIGRGKIRAVPKPVSAALPGWAPSGCNCGTLVFWSKCDRLDFRKVGTLQRKLKHEIGRMFRHFLWNGLSISVNDTPVVPVDPLFSHQGAETSRAEPYLKPLVYDLRLPGAAEQTSPVVVRFARLPITAWRALPVKEKRRMGIIGGAGVSIVRAGREIAHGWHFMGAKKRQNYDDWWRCEVRFDPALDEWFGVTHSKQSIRPTQELNEILAPDVERISRELSGQVRRMFAKTSLGSENPSAKRATERDWRLPRVKLSIPRGVSARRLMAHLSYRIESGENLTRLFFDWRISGSELVLELNRNHPFFKEIYERAQIQGISWIQRDLELILLSFARAVEMNGAAKTAVLRAKWGDVLATYVGE